MHNIFANGTNLALSRIQEQENVGKFIFEHDMKMQYSEYNYTPIKNERRKICLFVGQQGKA